MGLRNIALILGVPIPIILLLAVLPPLIAHPRRDTAAHSLRRSAPECQLRCVGLLAGIGCLRTARRTQ